MSIKEILDDKDLLKELIKRTDNIDKKLDKIISILNEDIQKNTKKMSEHINFIERIYDNVKSPLGFLCNRIYYFIGNKKFDLIKNNNSEINLDITNRDKPLSTILYDPNAFDKFK